MHCKKHEFYKKNSLSENNSIVLLLSILVCYLMENYQQHNTWYYLKKHMLSFIYQNVAILLHLQQTQITNGEHIEAPVLCITYVNHNIE